VRPVGRIRVPRALAILSIYLVVLGTVAAIATVAIAPLLAQAEQLSHDFPALVERAQDALVAHHVLRTRLDITDLLGAPRRSRS
jgi:predicted PurR-regulated permease PerM